MTEVVRKAVAEALGYEIESEQIQAALDTWNGASDGELRQWLKRNEIIFESRGGRGIELADEIDSLRIALAARIVK